MDVAMYPWIRQILAALPAHCYWHTRFTSSPLGSISPKKYINIRCEKSYNPYIRMNLMKVTYAVKNVDNRESHKDRYNEEERKRYEEDEEYRKRKQGQRRLFESKVVFCSVCNKSMSQKYYYDHNKTQKHNNNLENK